ncbi:hypothetical protein, partial [Pseudomonas sp. SWRI81]|uniref:hypothetical protein n=1 Tax=Pseudomonas sp. SWRI81 TaxID=2745505 RepID=UPI001EE1CCE1
RESGVSVNASVNGTPLSRASPLPQGNWGDFGDYRKHKGEPKLPFNFVVACSFFIIEGRSVVVFGNRGPLPLFWRPPSGVKSKRIFLSADLLPRQAIQPIRELPEGSFIVLCPVAGHS